MPASGSLVVSNAVWSGFDRAHMGVTGTGRPL